MIVLDIPMRHRVYQPYPYSCYVGMDDCFTPLNKALLNSLAEAFQEREKFLEKEKKRGVSYVPCLKPSLLFSVMANRLIGLVGEVVAEQANFSFATRPLAFRLLTLAPAASMMMRWGEVRYDDDDDEVSIPFSCVGVVTIWLPSSFLTVSGNAEYKAEHRDQQGFAQVPAQGQGGTWKIGLDAPDLPRHRRVGAASSRSQGQKPEG